MTGASSRSTSWPAVAGAVGLHVAVAGLLLLSGLKKPKEIQPLVNSVPVSIVSDQVIEAAAPDNPQETPSQEDGATAPPPEVIAPTPPAPTPAPPAPAPTPRPAEKATPRPPTPRPPAPTPPTKAQPTPPRPNPAPPRPAPRREEPSLDLDALAGPPRPNPNRGRPAPGQQGRGTAPQATGPQVTAIFNQVYSHWNVFIACNMPGGDQLRIQVDVSLSASGRITAGPTLVNPRADPVYRAAAEEAVRALRATAPFDVPDGFQGGAFRPTFNTERACRDR